MYVWASLFKDTNVSTVLVKLFSNKTKYIPSAGESLKLKAFQVVQMQKNKRNNSDKSFFTNTQNKGIIGVVQENVFVLG